MTEIYLGLVSPRRQLNPTHCTGVTEGLPVIIVSSNIDLCGGHGDLTLGGPMDATVAQRRQLEAAIGGDAAAFEALATESRAMIWSVCLRITGNAFDAEDALQRTLSAAWRGMPQFRREYSFGTWIYRIAANAASAIVRSRGTKFEVDESYSQERDFAEHLAEADLVQRTLNGMPAELRVALVLRELCDYTYAQIADYQGVGVPVVKSRIARGRQAFEDAMSSGLS